MCRLPGLVVLDLGIGGGLDGDGEEVNGVVSLLLHSSLLSVRFWVQIPPRESIFR